ncbi:hypothetical protein ABIE44_002950 [Marmoricola sp. OAE513]|uniref:GerMN domain-containing protein n=1 Tax=Marmoricola sp. OAE513 TaxID=2817894 RepID=UPI001AE50F8F
MSTYRHRALPLLALLLAALVAAGCSTLPSSGEVHTQPDAAADGSGQAPYFAPPGPVAGADREAIVRGFLLATQANPPSTSVARSFLTDQARITWKPTSTIVYDAPTLETRADSVRARLSGAHRLDQRGSWTGGSAPSSLDVDFNLSLENGEWRISNPPAAMPVPFSYFGSLYVPFLVYFFDRTGTVLVPSRVYLPLGEQIPSSLVRSLLAGPTDVRRAATATAFRSGIDLDLSVVVSDDGIAEIPMSKQIQRLSPGELYRVVLQLTATLRQLPGLVKIRITVDGIPVPLVNGQTDVSVDLAPEFDPVAAAGRNFVGVAEGRVVRQDGDSTKAVGGPLGAPGFALRSVAESVPRATYAGVSASGRRAYEAPASGSPQGSRVRSVVTGASNLLKPVYDRFGGLWLVDATPAGAVVHLVTDGRDRIVQVPGVSGRRVSAFTVTRDGTSLVAGLATTPAPTLVVDSLIRSENGQVLRAKADQRVVVTQADLAPIIDLGQDSATSVAVLTQNATQGTSGSGRVFSVELDGSPGVPGAVSTDPVPGRLAALLASPDDRLPLRVVTQDGRLLTQQGSGEWTRSGGEILAAAYPQ